MRDHSVAVDVSRIVTLDRIVDGRDPGRISGAGIVERDGHDESSQQNQGKDKGPSIPTSTCPAAIDMANESIEEPSRGPNRRHLRLVSIAGRSDQCKDRRVVSPHCQVHSSPVHSSPV